MAEKEFLSDSMRVQQLHIESNENEQFTILEGIISVSAALKSGNREIKRVYVDLEKYKKRDRKITRFVSQLKEFGIKYELCSRNLIDEFVREQSPSGGTTHGGVVAIAGERKYIELSQLIKKCADEKGYIVFLDGVEDPFNLGYSLRSLYAFGASGVILSERDRLSSVGVCARSSAGASELIDISVFPNFKDEKSRFSFISSLKENGFNVYCAAVSSKSCPLNATEFKFPAIIFIGGEKRGISPEFVECADALLHIPYSNPNVRYSLTTADSAALFGYAFSSQTKK